MKVRLLRRARIWHSAGETVKVSPAEGEFLLSVGSAAPVKEKKAKAPEKGSGAETSAGKEAEMPSEKGAGDGPPSPADAVEDGGTDCHTSVRAGSQ